jgi:hypothetical protein
MHPVVMNNANLSEDEGGIYLRKGQNNSVLASYHLTVMTERRKPSP